MHLMRRRTSPLLLMIASLLLAACGTSATPTPSLTPEPTYAADPTGVVLRVEWEGGFASPEMISARVPHLTVLGHGTVLRFDLETELIDERRLTPSGVELLLDRVAELWPATESADISDPMLVDAPLITLSAQIDGSTRRIASNSTDTGDDEHAAARAEYGELLDELADLSWIGEEHWVQREAMPYLVERVRIWIWPDNEEGTAVSWPLEREPSSIGTSTDDGRCDTLIGDEAREALATVDAQAGIAYWERDDRVFRVALRALLPDESSRCTADSD